MIFIRYTNGKIVRGVLLALGDQLVRVAIEGADDVAVFRLVSGVWVTEDCEVITIEVADDEASDRNGAMLLESMFPAKADATSVQRVM